ncbi:hypothetical protein FHR24_002090 [Wenyingzhuangia heitensis]|uniref:DUF3095 domain-containing protein n=1 Tax=Wenyingzhuangia heitensis TaxID=1487859 RepID=A0ABX0U9V3_9FLAO|nr:DUF3095 family protein [Wenyingzhuangia heitensis]NIJ45622.1 hypothetical protein [Wenyingzhuangia heitensis]
MVNNADFYKKLPKQTLDLADLLINPALFKNVPENWHVVNVDIENSSIAVQNGYHHDVNLSATGSIIVVLNELEKIDKKIRVPYFFGGDGSTFLVPDTFLKRILKVLNNYSIHIKNNANLILRVGSVSVKQLYKQGKKIKIAKHKLTAQLTIPIILGTGLNYAEDLVKKTFKESSSHKKHTPVNLQGMECRWQEIAAPEGTKKIVCLLAHCSVENKQNNVYASVLSQINLLFGSFENRKPITPTNLHLDTTLQKIKNEMKIKLTRFSRLYLILNWLGTVFVNFYLNFSKKGPKFYKEISQLSHTLMIDGTINTVFSGSEENIQKLIVFLDSLERDNLLIYGIHTTKASILSCYVKDRSDNHNHFVDGTEGGYTAAAKMFKSKLI